MGGCGDGEARPAEARGQEVVTGGVKEAIMKPAEPGFIHHGRGDDTRPLRTAVAVAHGGVRVVPNEVSGVEYDPGGLNAVGRDPAQQIDAETHTVPVVQVIIELA